jgi:hypothetical protein
MATNKAKREELERIYGKGSMFQESHCEDYISTLPKIKGYRKYLQEKHFTGKDIREQLEYHHMQHRSEGGRTTLDNGAVVNRQEHSYMHSLPREQEEIINNHIRQWKIDFITMTGSGGEIDHAEVEPEPVQDYIEITAKDYYKEHKTKLTRKQIEERERRREKRELQKLKKEWEER